MSRHRLHLAAGALAALALLSAVAPGTAVPAGATTASPLTGATSIESGRRHTCVALSGGQARCWGNNNAGQLGDGTMADRLRPRPVRNATDSGRLTGVTQVVGGGDHTCALLSTSQVRCWGTNSHGELGNGSTSPSELPVAVTQDGGGRLTGVASLAAGDRFTCARLTSGQAWCWGENPYGQLGRPADADVLRALPMLNAAGTGPINGVAELTAGDWHTCGRLTSGQVRCWGGNTFGQLGDGTMDGSETPVVVSDPTGPGPLTDVTQISAGEYFTCARLSSGEARCWGYNYDGQLGDGTDADRTRPVPVRNASDTGPLTGVRRVYAGNMHACAQLTNGQARCWGGNAAALGGNPSVVSPLPVTVVAPSGPGPLTGVLQLSLGDFHTCARVTGGEVRCWGSDSWGQLGNGFPLYGTSRPVVVVR